MDFGHGSWLHWTISGRLEKFYEGLRWTGWQDDIKDLALDQGMSIFPFLGTEEAQDIEATSRSPVPITELFSLAEPPQPTEITSSDLGRRMPG